MDGSGASVLFMNCPVRPNALLTRSVATTTSAMETRKQVHDDFNRRVDEANKGWAWGSPHVSSWYKNEFGRVSQNWPFGLIDYWRATLAPNPDDFVLERHAEPVA